MKIKVAASQFPTTKGDIKDNINKALNLADQAVAEGVNIFYCKSYFKLSISVLLKMLNFLITLFQVRIMSYSLFFQIIVKKIILLFLLVFLKNKGKIILIL